MASHLSAVHKNESAPAGMSAAEWQLRIDLAAAYQLAAIYGWTDLNNTHFSARVPGPEHHFLLNPFGMLFDEITASSLIKVDQDGTVLGNSHKKTIFLTGNNMWHSDASFKPVPAFLSVMCAYETPSEGGITMFVSLRAAYERLSPARKAELDPLIAIHDYVHSRSKVAPDAVSPELAASLPPVRQRLVRTNPATGAKNLFLGSHVREIEGMSVAAGRALIDALTDEAIQPEHVYHHAWQPGDVVLWDNRCLLHAGSGYDADRHRRYMRQTRVSGACSTLEEVGSSNRSRNTA